MITRISAALFALYLVHGSENVARDSAALAEQARKDAPSAMIGLCTDHAEACQNIAIKAVTGSVLPASAPAKPLAAGKEAGVVKAASHKSEPILTEAYPLPPRRKSAKI